MADTVAPCSARARAMPLPMRDAAKQREMTCGDATVLMASNTTSERQEQH